MKRASIIVLTMLVFIQLAFLAGCKTADEEEVLPTFTITSASGYSLNVTVIPKNPKDKNIEYTDINLFAAIRSHEAVQGTITAWSFKIRRDIAAIVIIDQNNYKNYNLTITGDLTIPGNDVTELYVRTPQPYFSNALLKEMFTFKPYVPTEVVVTLDITDSNGEIHTITGTGAYTYEESISYEE